ncbi:MAG: pectate lyase [Prevotella sp.]|nr:pectate lyase [Prevotella sp.]
MKKYLLTLFAAAISMAAVADDIPAFPGAEGHGRYVTGGRGGQVIHVTNLNDSGAGSFRNAVSGSSKKIVVFDVGGVIALKSNLTIGANTTILGQTAPAPGITLRYYTIQPSENCIIRFIRSRRGQEKDVNDGADAIWQRNTTGIMIDHCSFSWSIDEVASFYDNNNFTMQWCTIGESLNNAGHDKGAHGYGGIWGGKLASFHHNLICHVNNRSPRFNGARYEWKGYTSNKLYNQYKWANEVQAENVDFRNCVIYNCGNGCYGGPGGGQINIVNNYYKTGPAATTNRVTQVTVGASGNASGHPNLWTMTSRYYINGNQMNSTANYNGWSNISYDSGTYNIDGEEWSPDPNHLNGENVIYKKNSSGTDCVRIRLEEPAPTGEVTTHTAAKAFDKVLTYSGASLNMDNVDERYFTEARNGSATYSGSVTGKKGRIDLVSDVNGYTEENFGTGSREEAFDTDKDGIPDAWETANGLNPNDATDAVTYTLDPAKYYMNIEVYANSLVQDIMLAGNADAEDAAKEYYPAYKKEDGTAVEAINTLGVDLSGNNGGETGEGKTYTVAFNATETQSEEGYFTFGDGKHNLNSKFTGTYNGTTFTQGLKMEGTTLIQFTTKATATVIIAQSTWSEHTIKFDDTELDLSSATTPTDSEGVRVYTIAGVGAGTHKIARGSGESGIFYVEVREAGTTGISQVRTSAITATEYYDLSGRRLTEPQRGINIRVERLSNGQSITSKVIK